MIASNDEPMECTSESMNNNKIEVNATNSEKTVIQLNKLKLVPSSQNTASSNDLQYFLAEGEEEIVKGYCAKVAEKMFGQNC